MENQNNLAYICSPYRGNIYKRIRNIRYARKLTKTALELGYAPVTPHLYLTQVTNDSIAGERQQGMAAGINILMACGTIIIGTKYGISTGMAAEIEAAKGHKEIRVKNIKIGGKI